MTSAGMNQLHLVQMIVHIHLIMKMSGLVTTALTNMSTDLSARMQKLQQ